MVAAIFARRCSAIFSFNAFLPAAGPKDLEKEAVLFCDEAKDALGLFGSFSSAVLSRLSNVSNMLWFSLSGYQGNKYTLDLHFPSLGPDQGKDPVGASVGLSHLWICIGDTTPDELI